jgi:predicted transcriptional regulator
VPDDSAGSTHVSLRIPGDLVQAFDKLPALLDRPRLWVMLRAFCQYLEDEGAELTENAESLIELDGARAPRLRRQYAKFARLSRWWYPHQAV